MKVYVRGNKWLIRAVSAVMFIGPVIALAVQRYGWRFTLLTVGHVSAALLLLACMFFGAGIFASTFKGEVE